ncbi:MAG TPA: DUF262 domain-containing HNH endonuclease family protein [Steroidobacteraceae bacterium]|nr:DUF262 domain-containing HNH endonuclease family protein [Steroidobacteraceae bacterium]
MDSDRSTVQQLFKPERQFCVPLYQRAYVWNQQNQWSRLWSDIQEKAENRLAGLTATPHFMGAIVLDPQERKRLIGVEKVHIIDGQQRMTTLQFALAALSIMLRAWGHEEYLAPVEACLKNSDERNMRDKMVEPFKVWPTFIDREPYTKAIVAASLDELRKGFRDHFTQQQTLKKIGVRHPAALAAIWYFTAEMAAWMPKAGKPAPVAAEALTEAILQDLVVIAITLDDKDDAQVIFETLNGHGVELTATDLIRNYIFLRAEAEGGDSHTLYDSKWKRYEDQKWKMEERRGRLIRPRIEWFIQTVLQVERRDEVDQARIYAEYRSYVARTGITSEAQLEVLGSYADSYQALLDGDASKPIGRFGKRFANWDVSTTYVLALAISKSGCTDAEQDEMFSMLGSYLVRRAICDLTNKNYNKSFLQFLKNMKAGPLTPAGLQVGLEAGGGDSTRWPLDDEFHRGFLQTPLYPDSLSAPEVRSILVELENALRTARTEEPVAPSLGNLDIDHMLPKDWAEHWPLPDGTKVTASEVLLAGLTSPTDPNISAREAAIHAREALVQTIGNLTLLHYGTNRAAQNRAFDKKRELFLKHSNLHLNREMLTASAWDENSIQARAESLYRAALRVWPGPTSASPGNA